MQLTIIYIGSLIKDGQKFEINDVLQKITKQATTDITRLCKPEITDKQIQDFLGYLSTLVPFAKENSEVLDFFQKTFHLSREEFNRIINRLEASKFFVSSSYARFNPEIIGIQILKNWINQSDRMISDLSCLHNFPLSVVRLIFRNLGYALDEEQYHTISGILENYIDNLNGSAQNITPNQYIANLQIVSSIAHIVPDASYDLLCTYIEQIPQDENKREAKFGRYHSLRPDIFKDIIEALLSIGYNHVKIYTVIRNLYSLSLPAGTNGDLFAHWLKYAVSYQHCSNSSISNFLDFFKDEIENNDNFALKFCEIIIHQLLSFSYERSYCIYLTIHMAEYLFPLSDEIIKIRMQTINLLLRMLNASSNEMVIIAIRIIEHHCWYTRLNLSPKYLQQEALERQTIIQTLSSKADTSDNFAVRALIENLFLEWWGKNVPGGEEIPNHLKIFKRTPEYLKLKILFFPNYFVPDFSTLEKRTPKENKWEWLSHNLFHSNETPSSEEIEKYLIIHLFTNTISSIDIYEFFQCIERIRELTGIMPRNMDFIIQQWIQKQFDLFSDLVNYESYWSTFPKEYKNIIIFNLAKLNSIFINNIGNEIFADTEITDYDKIETLLRLFHDSSIERKTSDYWIGRLRGKKDKVVNFFLLSHLFWISIERQNYTEFTDTVIDIINEFETIDDSDWKNLETALFKYFSNDYPKTEQERIREALFNKILINEYIYPDHTGILYCIQTIDDLIAFVDKRLDYLLNSGKPFENYLNTRCWHHHSWNLPVDDCSDVERLLNVIADWISVKKLPLGYVGFIFSLISCEKNCLIHYLSKKIDSLSLDALVSMGGLLQLSEESLEIIVKILDKLSIEDGDKRGEMFLLKVSEHKEANFLISSDQKTVENDKFLALLESLKLHLTSTKGKIIVRERERDIKSELQWKDQLIDRIKNSGGEW